MREVLLLGHLATHFAYDGVSAPVHQLGAVLVADMNLSGRLALVAVPKKKMDGAMLRTHMLLHRGLASHSSRCYGICLH